MGKKKTKIYEKEILEIFNKYPKKSYNYRQIKSNIKEKKDILIIRSLQNLNIKNRIIEISPGKYILNRKQYIVGEIDKTKKGSAYLVSPDYEKDFFISESNINKALNGDKVSLLNLIIERLRLLVLFQEKKKNM